MCFADAGRISPKMTVIPVTERAPRKIARKAETLPRPFPGHPNRREVKSGASHRLQPFPSRSSPFANALQHPSMSSESLWNSSASAPRSIGADDHAFSVPNRNGSSMQWQAPRGDPAGDQSKR